jgi:hypothetical protein
MKSIESSISTAMPQLLHGYDDGHRLLAASEPLDERTRDLVDRLSDAVGTRPDQSIDGYLTGYPLPDGRYALARTWYAWELPRPNCVWTHTIVLDARAIASLGTHLEVFRSFRRPQVGHSIYDYSLPLQLESNAKPIPALPASVHFSVISELVRLLYESDDEPASAAVEDAADREAIASAIWLQQWPSLRKRFAFCTGAVNIRTVGHRAFDLNLSSPSYLAYSAPNVPVLSSDPELFVLARDLAQPSIEFREFLGFAGAGIQRRRVMSSLARIWARLDNTLPADIELLAEDLLAMAPRTESMRRLKRRLFRIPGALIARVASPTEVLTKLSHGSLADSVTAEDASLAAWASEAWNESPRSLIGVYGAIQRNTARKEPLRSDSARTVAQSVVSSVIRDRSTPSELRLVAVADPLLAGILVKSSLDASWWVALGSMPMPVQRATLKAMSGAPRLSPSAFDVAIAGALKVEPAESSHAIWAWLLEQNPSAAVRSLVGGLSMQSERDLAWIATLARESSQLESILASGPPWTWLAILAECIPLSGSVLAMGIGPWSALVNSRQTVRLMRGLGVLTTIAIVDPQAASQPIGVLYAELYHRLATQEASQEWVLVRQHLPRDHNEWDRCGMLLRGIVAKLSHYSVADQESAVGAAIGRDLEAGERLAEAIASRKTKRRQRSRPWWSDLLK